MATVLTLARMRAVPRDGVDAAADGAAAGAKLAAPPATCVGATPGPELPPAPPAPPVRVLFAIGLPSALLRPAMVSARLTLPALCRIVPALLTTLPTANTSLGPLPQTPFRFAAVPDVSAVHETPSLVECRIVPPAPTT